MVSKFSMEERRMITIVTPYEKTTREQIMKQKKNVFGNRLYLTNPTFYMTGKKEILNIGQTSGNYQFVGGLYIPDKAHVYQPLELK